MNTTNQMVTGARNAERVSQLEKLATEIVGDCESPNVFFVGREGVIELVTTNFDTAYSYFSALPYGIEKSLEDRRWGVIADNEIDESDEFRNSRFVN